ncbi:MAG: hypothetical protein OEZ06_12980 [Myxococcales bacterium]|nr:hypothetical protein [Myxococcales bacterium]
MSRRRSKSKRHSRHESEILFDDPERDFEPEMDWEQEGERELRSAFSSVPPDDYFDDDDEPFEDLDMPFADDARRRGGYRDMDDWG